MAERGVKFTCKGCEAASNGPFGIDECVHDADCVFYKPDAEKTFDERVIEAVADHIRKGGKLRQLLLDELSKEETSA